MPPSRHVRFRATDGKPVTARFTPAGRHAPAVVLLHEIRGGPDQWDPLVPDLHEAGFATLAYRSRPSIVEHERIPDALGALRWLRARPGVDGRRLGLVGASIGASTTVLAMAGEGGRLAKAAVALSPPDSSDIWDLQGSGRYRPHDLLLVSDERESSSAEGMLDGARRSRALRSERPGHGVTLLAEPGIRGALLRWLETRVKR
jgi:dipeptidyl aminopeptidase/acylaminoacyl peptidase